MTNTRRKSFSDIVSNKQQKEMNFLNQNKIKSTDNIKLITFQLSESRWVALKMRSLEEKRPMRDIITEAIAKDYESKGLNW